MVRSSALGQRFLFPCHRERLTGLNSRYYSRNLSARTKTYSKRLIGESDALAVEVGIFVRGLLTHPGSLGSLACALWAGNVQVKSLQAAIKQARAAVPEIEDDDEAGQVEDLLHRALETLEGKGPGGDL